MMRVHSTVTTRVAAVTLAMAVLPMAAALAQKVGPASNPNPADGATGVATTTSLSWSAATDARRFDVRFGTQSPPPIVARNLSVTTYHPGPLATATKYYWQIDSRGKGNDVAPGPLWSFTTQSAPQPDPPGSQTLERLRVMTWNIRMGQNLAGTMNVDAQVALMADSGAHIIALQEVTVTSDADLRALYKSKLEALTGQEWTAVWAPAPRPATATPEGNLMLTALPVVSSSIFQHDSAPWDPTWLDTKRAAAQIGVAVNGLTLNVFGTHLPVEASHRRQHIDAMLAWIATFPGPRLFGGDFNMVAGTVEYDTMSGVFADTWPLLAPGDQGFTMDKRSSAGGAPGRIDYWWQEITDTQAHGTEIWVIKTTRSDHHAVVLDVQVQVK
jgi:endonuclease/exonuclease/phosphatase family metal-dependent hydrolase